MAAFRSLVHGLARSGGSSGRQPGLLIVRTAEEWARCWERMTKGQRPGPEIPSVDWSVEVVVVVNLGSRPTTGYAVTIDQIVAGDQTLEVSVTESRPAGGFGGRMVTHPVHAVAVPARDARDNLRLVQRVTTRPE